ncbi:hypothetical protein MOSE0_N11056 [Monosporozyma servazzii]
MDNKFNLLLDAAKYLDVTKSDKYDTKQMSEKINYYKRVNHNRINKINQLKLKRGAISKSYSLILQDIIMGFNKNVDFLKSHSIDTIYLDQLMEIGVNIRDITSIDNCQYDCDPKYFNRNSTGVVTKERPHHIEHFSSQSSETVLKKKINI